MPTADSKGISIHYVVIDRTAPWVKFARDDYF